MRESNEMKPSLVAIYGGIGAGKSVVSACLRAMGFQVYDCDSEAKRLMDSSFEIKRCIREEISREAINADGSINRCKLSAIVFGNNAKLNKLNSIVHSAVRRDITRWAAMGSDKKFMFIETAILYQSGIDNMVDKVIEVTAPQEIRVLRVMCRNNMKESDVINRIESQKINVNSPHRDVTVIINDDDRPILPQILSFLDRNLCW